METQFRRLAWLVAAVSFIGFSFGAAWSYYKENSAQDAVSIWYENLNRSLVECEKDRTSIYCEGISHHKKEFNESVQIRDAYTESLKTNLIGLVFLPIASLFLFFSLRWVITGQKPQWFVRQKP